MGVVEDMRRVLQDLVTPDLRALMAEVRALREEMNRRFDYIESSFRVNERLSLLEAE